MNVKRYFAPTAREALRALKEALGPDAIVLSNRAVEGGVEILALPGEAVGALQAANRAAVAARAGSDASASSHAVARGARADAHRRRSRFPREPVRAGGQCRAQRRPPVPRPAPEPAPVVRAFNPPRIETADYAVRNRDGVLRNAAADLTPGSGPAAGGPAVFSGRAAGVPIPMSSAARGCASCRRPTPA